MASSTISFLSYSWAGRTGAGPRTFVLRGAIANPQACSMDLSLNDEWRALIKIRRNQVLKNEMMRNTIFGWIIYERKFFIRNIKFDLQQSN